MEMLFHLFSKFEHAMGRTDASARDFATAFAYAVIFWALLEGDELIRLNSGLACRWRNDATGTDKITVLPRTAAHVFAQILSEDPIARPALVKVRSMEDDDATYRPLIPPDLDRDTLHVLNGTIRRALACLLPGARSQGEPYVIREALANLAATRRAAQIAAANRAA